MESFSLPLLITTATLGGLALLGVVILVIIGFVLLERTSRIEQISYRMENVEDYLRDLSSTVNEAQSNDDDGVPMFRSMDGKYVASSLEELIAMMQADPESSLNQQGDSPDNMNKFFDQLSGDSDDDPQEPWKKKKKD
jgi:hypothetical protein